MPHDPLLYRRLILGLWFTWAVYWFASAAGAKATRRRESPGSRLAHLIPLAAGGALLAWDAPAGWLAQRLWRGSSLFCGVGVALIAAGLAFAVWARVHLGRNWSGTVTVKKGHELIRSGPYRWVRHPIYTGILAAVLGTAIASGTVHGAIGFLIIAVALLRKLRIEEAFMRETFPGEYERYAAAVPALVPFTRLPRSAPH